jgi:hypothetical protein
MRGEHLSSNVELGRKPTNSSVLPEGQGMMYLPGDVPKAPDKGSWHVQESHRTEAYMPQLGKGTMLENQPQFRMKVLMWTRQQSQHDESHVSHEHAAKVDNIGCSYDAPSRGHLAGPPVSDDDDDSGPEIGARPEEVSSGALSKPDDQSECSSQLTGALDKMCQLSICSDELEDTSGEVNMACIQEIFHYTICQDADKDEEPYPNGVYED